MSEDTAVDTVVEPVNEVVKQDKRTQKYEPKTCPVCNKLVSGRPWQYKRHVKECKKSAGVAEEPKKQTEATVPRGLADVVTSARDIKDDGIRRIMEEALATQEALRKSPQAFVGEITSEEAMTLRKTYAPETLERFDEKGRPLHTHTAYLADANAIHVAVARGYVPVLRGGQFVKNRGGDILCTMDRRVHDAIIRNVENESRERISRVSEKVINRNADLRNGDIKEEALGQVGTITLNEDDRIKRNGE